MMENEKVITVRAFPLRKRAMEFRVLQRICGTEEFASRALDHSGEDRLNISRFAAEVAVEAVGALLELQGADQWSPEGAGVVVEHGKTGDPFGDVPILSPQEDGA